MQTSANKKDIYLKIFDSDETILIDNYKDEVIPGIEVKDNNMVYYISDDNNLKIMYVNLENLNKQVVKSYKLNKNNTIYVSKPSIDNDFIVWSENSNGKDTILKYDIKNNSIDELESNDIYNPIILNNKIYAVKSNEYIDDEIKSYVREPRETIFGVYGNEKLLFWMSSFSKGGYI